MKSAIIDAQDVSLHRKKNFTLWQQLSFNCLSVSLHLSRSFFAGVRFFQPSVARTTWNRLNGSKDTHTHMNICAFLWESWETCDRNLREICLLLCAMLHYTGCLCVCVCYLDSRPVFILSTLAVNLFSCKSNWRKRIFFPHIARIQFILILWTLYIIKSSEAGRESAWIILPPWGSLLHLRLYRYHDTLDELSEVQLVRLRYFASAKLCSLWDAKIKKKKEDWETRHQCVVSLTSKRFHEEE